MKPELFSLFLQHPVFSLPRKHSDFKKSFCLAKRAVVSADTKQSANKVPVTDKGAILAVRSHCRGQISLETRVSRTSLLLKGVPALCAVIEGVCGGRIRAQRWGTTDQEIKLHSAENPELSKVLSFELCDGSVHSLSCFAYYQKFPLSNFTGSLGSKYQHQTTNLKKHIIIIIIILKFCVPPQFIQLDFPPILFSHLKVACEITGELDLITCVSL